MLHAYSTAGRENDKRDSRTLEGALQRSYLVLETCVRDSAYQGYSQHLELIQAGTHTGAAKLYYQKSKKQYYYKDNRSE